MEYGTRDAVFADPQHPYTQALFAATPRADVESIKARLAKKAAAAAVMVTRRAECSCGQLSAVCSGEPVRISVCHCLACKRRSGSAFSYNVRFAEADVSIQGRAVEFTRIGDEGGRVSYSFCPDCGTTVHYRIDTQPGLVAIPVGAFADPSFPPPFQSFYHESRRCDWVEIRAKPLINVRLKTSAPSAQSIPGRDPYPHATR